MSKPALTVLASVADYPSVTECFNWRSSRPTMNCSSPGFFVELSYLLAERLNMRVKYINLEQENLLYAGTNLTEDDISIKHLRNGTADLLDVFLDTNFIGDDFTLSTPVYFSYTKFIVARTNSTLTDFFDFFTIYDSYIWIGIFACFILVLLIYFIKLQISFKLNINEPLSIGNFAWKLIRLKLNQSDSVTQKSLSSNTIFIVFALLQCGLVIRMYNNLITTQAVRVVNAKPFRDNELLQVLKNRKYSLIFQARERWWYGEIMTSMESPYFEIREAIKNNPILLAYDMGMVDENENEDVVDDFVFNKVREKNLITIGSNEDIAVARKAGFCSMVYFDTNFKPRPKSLIMRKNHPLLPRINELLLEETINIKRLHHKYYEHARPPKCEQGKNRGPEALNKFL